MQNPVFQYDDRLEDQPRMPVHDQDSASLEPMHSCLLSTQNNHIEIDFASSPLYMNSGLDLSGVAINEHDRLLQMCMNKFLITTCSQCLLVLLTIKDDTEFCILPLTSDMTINPFRCHPTNIPRIKTTIPFDSGALLPPFGSFHRYIANGVIETSEHSCSNT